MNIDAADRALRSKGFYLSSVSKLAPELGYIASSRDLKKSNIIGSGESGFGRTAGLALADLLQIHNTKETPDLADLEAALEGLTRAVRNAS